MPLNLKSVARRWPPEKRRNGPGAVMRICSMRRFCRPMKAAISISCAARDRRYANSAVALTCPCSSLALGGVFFHRGTEFIGLHAADNGVSLGVELLLDRRDGGAMDQRLGRGERRRGGSR